MYGILGTERKEVAVRSLVGMEASNQGSQNAGEKMLGRQCADTKRLFFNQPFIHRTKRYEVETNYCMNRSQIDVVSARNSAHGLTEHGRHLLHGVNKRDPWLGLHQ